MGNRLGVILRPQQPPESLVAAAQRAEELGLDEMWVFEDCFLEGGISQVVAALAVTERIVIGVGLLPVPLRNVALAAMELATVDRLFPGRARFVFGHGVQEWMAQAGARVESPMTLMREYLTALRALLDGERISVSGRYVNLDDVQLAWPPTGRVKLWMGAEGPKSLALCGEITDGIVLAEDATIEELARGVALVNESARAAGRSEALDHVSYLRVFRGPLADERLAKEEREKANGVGVGNDPDRAAATINAMFGVGISTVMCLMSAEEEDPLAYFEWVATEIKPRLSAI